MHKPEQPDLDLRTSALITELRDEQRYPCTVTLVVVQSSNNPEPFPAHILEISRSGLRLRAGHALAPGREITVSFVNARKNTVIECEARYCQSLADGKYEIGAKITGVATTPVID